MNAGAGVLAGRDQFAETTSRHHLPAEHRSHRRADHPPRNRAGRGKRAAGDQLCEADKVTTVSRAKLGARIGALSPAAMVQLSRAITVFLGLVR